MHDSLTHIGFYVLKTSGKQGNGVIYLLKDPNKKLLYMQEDMLLTKDTKFLRSHEGTIMQLIRSC